MKSKWKTYAKNTVITLGVIGMADIILQSITSGEFKLIHTVLDAIRGA